MTILEFDSEGTTGCPKNETATKEECQDCNYCKAIYIRYADRPAGLGCIYKNVFPEEEYATVSKL